MDDPMHKVYITSQPLEGLPVILLLFLLTYLPKLEYDVNFGALVRRQGNYLIDGIPLVAGLACLLHQVHPAATRKLLSYLGQFVRTRIQQVFGESDVDAGKGRAAADVPPDVLNVLIFLDHLCKFSSVPRSVVHAYVPPYIFDAIRFPPVSTSSASTAASGQPK